MNNSFSATRTTAAVAIGTGGGLKGDYLERVLVTTLIGTADLTISDGSGVVVCVIPGASAAGTVAEVGVIANTSGFSVALHATDVGAVTCIGKFT